MHGFRRTGWISGVLLLATLWVPSAHAHVGHGTSSWMEGLLHPFGVDHLLAMVAVGVWSVQALPGARAWLGPAAFMLALMGGALVGGSGWTIPWVEAAIAASVVVFGVMLMIAYRPLPRTLGLGLIAMGAWLHGLAHGTEAPPTDFVGYAAGFLLTTLALHLGGVAVGLWLHRWQPRTARWGLVGLGGLTGLSGLLLWARL
jgi:urease accessory protein